MDKREYKVCLYEMTKTKISNLPKFYSPNKNTIL
ncbi:hypothetical protein RB653_000427 [Dictyostelium firmibasis]|uniref:Uncharacterized protein n=1 Tax=Dictyostelium firmibasis TaxID=79012 RepID=A0AAN7U6Z5_9MYCE